MKCARCDRDTTYPERSGGKCPGCGGQFAFEPRAGDPLSDMAWKAAIDQVSSIGTVRFTLPHLHYAIGRRMKKPGSGGGITLLILGVIVLIVTGLMESTPGMVVGGMMFFFGCALMLARSKSEPGPQLSEAKFKVLYGRWVGAHGPPKNLIVPRVAARAATSELAHELESYSFDRAVICDRSETVDLLLGNDFHFENNCAVLTAGGYPEHAAPIIHKMLKQNPRLEVFVLHDATVEGCVLAHYLKSDPHWFANSDVRIFDVALRPAQAQKSPAFVWQEGPGHVEPHPALSADERRWLASHWMSLAAVTPEQTIKRLYRAMQTMPSSATPSSNASDSGSSDSGGIMIWTSDATASDGGGDSFG